MKQVFKPTDRPMQMLKEFEIMVQQMYIPENNDDYWDKVLRRANKFVEDYKDVPLALDMTLGLLNYLEKTYKEQYKKQDTKKDASVEKEDLRG